jgi:hypothetical protein
MKNTNTKIFIIDLIYDIIKNKGSDIMDMEKVKLALPKIEEGLNKYLHIMDRLNKVDVSRDIKFQKRYKGFYRMRRNQDYCDIYFSFMEHNKNRDITFKKTLEFLHNNTKWLEASFSSKLLATLNPNKPVWDEFVLKNLNLKKPYTYSKDRFNKTVNLYYKIENWYKDFLKTDDSKEMLQLFNEYYPDKDITEIKKIDLILWQMR